MPGEVLGFAQEQLFAAGALDVWLTPVQMKKNRPGVILSALVPQRLEEEAYRTILRETPNPGRKDPGGGAIRCPSGERRNRDRPGGS